jgi:hypothetical protein
MKDIPVIAHMATMPPRREALKETIPRILSQVDALNIYLNEFDAMPDVLFDPKITLFHSANHLGDIGDVGKFFLCNTWADMDAYIFTMDDKIIYPPDYVRKSIEAIERYDRKAVISFHGRNIKPGCRSYYLDFAAYYGVYDSVPADQFVHEVGTGAMSFYSRAVKCSLDCFEHINMTDIYFSMHLQRQKIPMVVAAHRKGWVRMSRKHNDNHSIHAIFNKSDKLQTDVVNGFNWKIRAL